MTRLLTPQELHALTTRIMRERHQEASCAFIAGSFVRGDATSSSDLDLVVIYPRLPNAYRESFLFEGMPVEVFVNDLETLAFFMFERDRPAGFCTMANMVTEGLVWPEESNLSEQARGLAREVLELGPSPWRQDQIDASRYAITDLLDDLHAPRNLHEQIATGALLYRKIAEHYLRTRKEWSASNKWIPRRLHAVDPLFASRFQDAMLTLCRHGEDEPLINLAMEVINQDGGPLFDGYMVHAPANWRRIAGPEKVDIDMGPLASAPQDVVELVPHSTTWSQRFEDESRALRAVLPHDLDPRIEHIGSTAVPGLLTRPIIDIMLLIEERSRFGDLRPALESLGYVMASWPGDSCYMLFIKGMPPFGQRRTHHVHVRHPEDMIARRKLKLRHLLRSSPRLVQAYGRLKRELAEKYAEELDSYRAGRTAFIDCALARHLIGERFPVLETARLRLVQIDLRHARGVAKIYQDRDSYRFLSQTGAIEPEAIPGMILKEKALCVEGSVVTWALEDHDGNFCGYIALQQPGSFSPNLRYATALDQRRKGYMREALEVVKRFIFERLMVVHITAHIHHRNHVSAKLLAEIGFEEGEPVVTPRGARREFKLPRPMTHPISPDVWEQVSVASEGNEDQEASSLADEAKASEELLAMAEADDQAS